MLFLITLSWQGKAHLEKLKNSLLPIIEGKDIEWWIKDNGSTDGTVEAATGWSNQVKIISYPNNSQNFSEGCNYLVNLTKAKDNDNILLLNNDIVFQDSNAIHKMISLLSGNVGLVGAKLLYPAGKTIQHAGIVFTNRYGLPINYRAGEFADDTASKNRLFQSVTGACALLKAGTYRSICKTNKSGLPGLDENYIWCFEDVDMGLHISKILKQKVVYCGATNIIHEESASLKKNQINKLFLTKNAQYFLNKWAGKYDIDFEKYKNPRAFLL